MTDFFRYDQDNLVPLLSADMLAEQKHAEAEPQKAISRNEGVAHLYEKLYQDNATGKVTDEWISQV